MHFAGIAVLKGYHAHLITCQGFLSIQLSHYRLDLTEIIGATFDQDRPRPLHG